MHTTANKERLLSAINNILSEELADGFTFSCDKISLLELSHKTYPGFRIMLRVETGIMKDSIQIDIGVGDVVTPETYTITMFHYQGRPLFEGEISLLIYPIETIFAEKLETVIPKGRTNSRMKDYHDLLLLSREKQLFDEGKLQSSLLRTFLHRNTPLTTIIFDERDLSIIQPLWTNHLQMLGRLAAELNLPTNIAMIIAEINNRVLPFTLTPPKIISVSP